MNPLNISWDPWNNFNCSQLHHGTCGGTKCYFPVRTSASPQDDAMGWLIQENIPSLKPRGHSELSDWIKTWEFARDLDTRHGHGANHLLLGPPRRIALGSRDAALLNAHLWWLDRQMSVLGRYAEGNVLVQPVRSCPSPSCILMGCGHKTKSFARMLETFLEHVHDKAIFMYTLEGNIGSVNAMLKVTTCLHRDFQAFIRNDGQILHLDLDRCIANQPTPGPKENGSWTDDCLGNALAMLNTEIIKSVL